MSELTKASTEMSDTGQRAFVTLLFSDFCKYTSLSEVLDIEEIDAVRRQLDELAQAVVTKHGGLVTQSYGDGHLCVFGFPDPGEDDVRRSIDAALELHAAIKQASWSLPPGFHAALHTGIHSGLVFIRRGTELHGRYQLSGDAVNTTARLCANAESDEIFVTAAALRGSEQFFDATRVPDLVLRGKSAPQDAYRITGRSSVRTRFEASTRRGLTTFVNRHSELKALMHNLGLARAGRGRLLVVRGPAGIGKTRLLEEFSARAAHGGVRVRRGTCENYGELVPLEPWSQILRQVFGAGPDASDGTTEALVRRRCEELGAAVAKHESTYAMLLSLQPAKSEALSIEVVVRALHALIEGCATDQPLALVLDDWQWADGASRAVLAQLRDVAIERGTCLVIGMRSSATSDPTLQPDDAVEVVPLTERDSEKILQTLRPDSLNLSVSELVLQRAGGNPLFLEELCRALPQLNLEQQWPQARLEVPTTLQGVIQSRVAALPREKRELLRTAAVIGIEFNVGLLLKLSDVSEDSVEAQLEALTREDLIYRSDAASTFRFKHGLTREVVYESVLIGERKLLHGRVAQVIEQTASAAADNMQTAEALAYHYRGSGDLARAARYAELAGDQAMTVSALDRACDHYLVAMNALDAMPASTETRRKWLAISAKWGLPFVFSPVQSDSKLKVLHTAARYADELGDLEAKARSWHWLGWAHYSLGNYNESVQHLQAALELAQEVGDLRLVVQIEAGLGQSLAASCKYDAGLDYLDRATARKREQAQTQKPSAQRRGRLAQGYLYALAATALVHADRGDFTLADELFEDALAPVARSGHAIEGSMLALRAIALVWRGHWAEAREIAQRGWQNAQRVNSAFNFVNCSFIAAYAAWQMTRSYKHIERMRARVDWTEAQHLELFASNWYGWCAHALQTHGDPELARTYVNRALRRAAEGDPLGEAIAHRVLARLGPTPTGPATGDARAYAALCLDKATRAGEARGSRHEAVKTALLRAELCRESGDVEGARRWAASSRDAARELGMPWHLVRAERLLSE